MTLTAADLWNQFQHDEGEREKAGVEPHSGYYDVMQTKALIVIAAQLEEIAQSMRESDEEE